MATENSQVIYGWTEGAEPVSVGEGDSKKKLVSYESFQEALVNAEQAFGQKILQDNAETNRLANLISEQAVVALDPGTATLSQTVTELNKTIAILQNLVLQGKNRN